MKLKDVFKDIDIMDYKGDLNVEITNISSDSRLIKPNGLFFAINGYKLNGLAFIDSAINNGAVAIVVDQDTNMDDVNYPNIPIIKVDSIRKNLGLCSCNLYDHPSKKLKLIGVTGTKGKTTSTFMIKSILQKQGYKVGLIGSIAIYINDEQLEITDRTTPESEKIKDNDRTTPESYKIQQSLDMMVKEGVDIAILEVSSQSMKLDRVVGCDFDICLFTNLSEDHISPNEHPNMEDYYQAKLSIMKLAPVCVLNLDNDYTRKAVDLLEDKSIITFGIDHKADVMAKDFSYTNASVSFDLITNDYTDNVTVSIPGKYMAYNALGAIAVTRYFGATIDSIKNGLNPFSVFGRSELVPNKLGYTIMIDYAHTPSSLESILKTVKPYTKGRVICTWGVGGDRDAKKRPIMGEISGTLADFTVLTSDQVRTEDPRKILADIEVGLKKSGGAYTVILNRTEAIRYAIHMMNKDDILVIPGLGNDLYIEYMGVKYPYNERIVIAEIIDEMLASQEENKKTS